MDTWTIFPDLSPRAPRARPSQQYVASCPWSNWSSVSPLIHCGGPEGGRKVLHTDTCELVERAHGLEGVMVALQACLGDHNAARGATKLKVGLMPRHSVFIQPQPSTNTLHIPSLQYGEAGQARTQTVMSGGGMGRHVRPVSRKNGRRATKIHEPCDKIIHRDGMMHAHARGTSSEPTPECVGHLSKCIPTRFRPMGD